MIAAVLAAMFIAQDPAAGSTPPGGGDPSLDEALGIGGGEKDRSASGRADKVERSLAGAAPREILDSALDDMRRSAELLAGREAGLPARRAQESVVRKLDELIASAERMKREQQKGSQSSGDQRSAANQDGSRTKESQGDRKVGGGQREDGPEKGADRDRSKGSAEDDGSRSRNATEADADRPPQPLDPTQQDAQFDEARAEWGRLPPRVREAVRQGFRDPMSAAYRRLTQDYYRRLAGEGVR